MNESGMETYRKVGLPALAVLETILTKGKSPGTTAMGQQAAMQGSDDRKEALRKAAMEEKLYGYKMDEYAAGKNEREAKRKELERRTQIQSEIEAEYSAAQNPSEQMAAIRKGLVKLGQYGSAMPKEKPTFDMEEFAEKLRIQDEIAAAREERRARRDKEKITLKDTEGSQKEIEAKKLNADEALERISLLKTHPGKQGAVGAKGWSSLFGIKDKPAAGSKAAGFSEMFEGLRSLITLENVGKLKGVLSESDMKIIKQASTSLSLDMPEEDFNRELDRVETILKKVSSGGVPSFNTLEEAEAAGLAPGTKIRVGGRDAIWE